jgi:hypothetical protein
MVKVMVKAMVEGGALNAENGVLDGVAQPVHDHWPGLCAMATPDIDSESVAVLSGVMVVVWVCGGVVGAGHLHSPRR